MVLAKMEQNKFDARIYQKMPQIVLGFHGCDKSVAMEILNSSSTHLKSSKNNYDWLGDGIYFWLNDPQRAYEWACQMQIRKPKSIKEPFVIGAVIDLGLCLNFSERESVLLLQKAYENLRQNFEVLGLNINDTYQNKVPDEGGFNLLRPLDCAVIKHLHSLTEQEGISFDTVYGYFQEGKNAYDGAGIKEKSHIQICVRNTDCIKGYFLPRVK